MTKIKSGRAKLVLGLTVLVALGGCQRPSGQNEVTANMGGNQALSQNPNSMSDSGLPRTGNTPLNELVPNASDQYSNSSDEIPQPKRK